MEDVKGKAVEVESMQGKRPMSQELVFDDDNGNAGGSLRRLSEMRRRRQTAKVCGFPNSGMPMRRQFIPKPILPPTPPTTEINRFTAQFLFKKELKCSDVGAACRIVIPKGYAEKHLPALTDREGIFMFMDDMDACEIWAFRYRYWHNNRSRMFVFEKTGDFVKAHGLQPGDTIMIYKDDQSERYGILARKAIPQDIGPQYDLLNRSRNFHAGLIGRNEIGTYFSPENNIVHSLPMNFPGGVVPDISNVEPPMSYQSSITFSSAGNF
ncbi:B3 domain-containing transcription factor FUS3-like [Actinidia eriantha]|uniref:B3 domain-containing transcription factor FUS3-like n=1 Tax=Actinidia eriantha TaxID=165200 RepID=UPI00258A0C84|nr:B3 domain-containing transcription factor FUS3-like [Actinidia eriantha]